MRVCVVLATLSLLRGIFGEFVSSPKYNYEIKFYPQHLDHFNFGDDRKFHQRYLISTSSWKSNGPIFFYCGNEGDIEWFCNNTGLMWDIAPKFNAMIVFAEHRYYGQSLPFGKDSYKDAAHLNYLSSQQALADFVELIAYLKRSISGASNSAVIAFGGSYGGMLASWLRMKYPSVVQGALAASAPIWQFIGLTPCYKPYEIITNDFRKTYPACVENIKTSWGAVSRTANSTSGLEWLSKTFKLCDPLKTGDELNNWLESIYFNLAMVDYPYPSSFLEPLPGWPVDKVCGYLKEKIDNDEELLKSLFSAVSVYFNYTQTKPCLNLSQDAVSSLGEQGWDYQACTEMVMPLCTNGITDMFRPNPFNLEERTKECKDQWGVDLRANAVEMEYGGKDIKDHTNIVFSNGDLDPWSGGGVLQSISESLVAIVIPNGAHHLDLRAATEQDPPELVAARLLEEDYIRKWITDYENKR